MTILRNALLLACLTFTLSACQDDKTSTAGATGSETAASATAASACAYQLVVQDDVDTPEAKVSVTGFETSDRETQSWVRASFALKDHDLRLTEEQVRGTLDHLYQRLATSCRQHPLQRAIVFLYPEGAIAGQSSAWIARLTTSSHAPEVELRKVLLKDERTDRFACLHGKEPGKSLDLGTRLPPEKSREIIGSWADPDSGLTMSLERVAGKVYQVYRSAYCSSSDRGEPVRQGPGKRFSVIDSRAGDYFEILPSGDLGVYDRQGMIDLKPTHRNLYPAVQPGKAGS